MNFEWDEEKRYAILNERGVDILEAALIFEGPVLTRIDDRSDYGEERWISLGLVDGEPYDGEPYTVVHTERQETTRLITAWKGGRRDLKKYQDSIARRNPGDEGPGGTSHEEPPDRG
ncbi:MAG: BrnT family toxin [Alphaproteobacteria bacterium]|nr:BrnT family toxin [Alphaproteobacteria bacterium]MCB9930225.1 BrnT family toxin [Alphaproteobacteria bacterium]